MSNENVYITLPRVYLNQSRWKTYSNCDRLYGWENVERLSPVRPRAPLVVGTAIHRAQVKIHQEGHTQESIRTASQEAADYVQSTLSAPVMGNDTVGQEMSDLVQTLIPAYHEHYGNQQALWKPLGMELDFEVEVGEGTGVYLVGTIDNLVTYMNALWIVDYKTMAKLDLREFEKYQIDIQLTAYLYGGTKKLSQIAMSEGKPPVMIRGAIIDGLIKTKIPQFHRELYTRTVDDLREFEVEFCMKAWEIAAKHAMVKNDRKTYDLFCQKMYEVGSSGWKYAFPKNTEQCFKYGTCAFRTLCVTDNEVRRLEFKSKSSDYVDAARERARLQDVQVLP